jgi:hypothetical protein
MPVDRECGSNSLRLWVTFATHWLLVLIFSLIVCLSALSMRRWMS